MKINEVTGGGRSTRKRPAHDEKTPWENNLSKLRGKERRLDPKSPIGPVKTSE